MAHSEIRTRNLKVMSPILKPLDHLHFVLYDCKAVGALTLLVGRQEGHTACERSCSSYSQKTTFGIGPNWNNSSNIMKEKLKSKVVGLVVVVVYCFGPKPHFIAPNLHS